MAALDTNVLVRFLVQDDVRQGALAKQLISTAVSDHRSLFIPITVLLELEWVLRSSFAYDKNQIIEVIANLLGATELQLESESSAEVGLELFRQNNADFADCIHIALVDAAGHSPLWSFDKRASKIQGAKLLK
jgi:predicted nucleic-acid-binding protein